VDDRSRAILQITKKRGGRFIKRLEEKGVATNNWGREKDPLQHTGAKKITSCEVKEQQKGGSKKTSSCKSRNKNQKKGSSALEAAYMGNDVRGGNRENDRESQFPKRALTRGINGLQNRYLKGPFFWVVRKFRCSHERKCLVERGGTFR